MQCDFLNPSIQLEAARGSGTNWGILESGGTRSIGTPKLIDKYGDNAAGRWSCLQNLAEKNHA
jgi:hypothetical protein